LAPGSAAELLDGIMAGCRGRFVRTSAPGQEEPGRVHASQVPPPVERLPPSAGLEARTTLENCSVSPVLTYHSQRVPSGQASQVSVFAA
jgi:hypothetical protein